MPHGSPLQVLTRNYNFRMGSLRRDEINIRGWSCPSASISALSALDVERNFRREEYERERARLLAANQSGT